MRDGWTANWAEMMTDDAKRATAEKAIARLKAEGLEIDPATGLPPRPTPGAERGPRIRPT